MKALAFAVVAALSLTPAVAQGLPPVVAKAGKWEFRKGSDSFSGKTECLVTLVANRRVQLSVDALYVSYRGVGGVKAYYVRLDDGPVSEMMLANNIEQSTSAIGFTGNTFQKIMTAKRFRIQAVTYVDLKNDDIDLASAAPLYARMLREC